MSSSSTFRNSHRDPRRHGIFRHWSQSLRIRHDPWGHSHFRRWLSSSSLLKNLPLQHHSLAGCPWKKRKNKHEGKSKGDQSGALFGRSILWGMMRSHSLSAHKRPCSSCLTEKGWRKQYERWQMLQGACGRRCCSTGRAGGGGREEGREA
ncbi:hypothetical protein JZ751_002757, partial [Albula glossodonta]